MKEFKKILFPVDLSEISPKLVLYVKYMAKKFDAEIHLLFVARILQHYTSIYVSHPSIDLFERELVEGAERKLYEFKEEHFGNLPETLSTVIIGNPAEEIIRYVSTSGIDLIVMGSHGRQGFDKVAFGSVAEKVVKSSPIPVLIVNPYRDSL